MTDSSQASAATNALKSKLINHYITDISFENPHAPGHVQGIKEAPQLKLNIDLNIAKLNDTTFALTQKIMAQTLAKANDKEGKELETSLFICELSYTGVFALDEKLSDSEKDKEVLTNCAETLFPFARRVVSDLTRDGGFPPLLLEPVDFNVVYEARKASLETSKSAAVN